jgi:predicted nucleic acid-binding protein
MAARTRRPVALRSAFWDTSALVPLCAQQNNSSQAVAFYAQYAVVVWWTTPVEIASALARLVRTSHLTATEATTAHTLSLRLADSWSVIQPSEIVRNKALQMVESYDLRAADALQLSAALQWCSDAPRSRVFLTADDRLLQAAILNGFDARRV